MNQKTIERCQDPGVPGKELLKLSGSVTIGEAAGLRQALVKALEAADELRLDLGGVTEIDLTGLQLLCATQLSAFGLGRQFDINAGGNGVFLDAVCNAGLQRHAGLVRDAAGNGIPMGGES
jgi:ABC-type transporter Mla MlaB component